MSRRRSATWNRRRRSWRDRGRALCTTQDDGTYDLRRLVASAPADGHADGIGFFAGEDLHLQPILRQRNRAGRVRVERAGRVVGLVEVENRRAVVLEIRIEKPRGFVGLVAARRVAEDEVEALRARRERPQPQR